MRMIDADALTELFRKERESGRDYMSPDFVVHKINSQPTAYDVDKVVEKIQNIHLPLASQTLRIIGIIKAGGKNQ